MFIPVPPNASFPIITANATANANQINGTSGGIINGINAPETKNPSSMACPFLAAYQNSIPKPTKCATTKIGMS